MCEGCNIHSCNLDQDQDESRTYFNTGEHHSHHPKCISCTDKSLFSTLIITSFQYNVGIQPPLLIYLRNKVYNNNKKIIDTIETQDSVSMAYDTFLHISNNALKLQFQLPPMPHSWMILRHIYIRKMDILMMLQCQR